MLPQRKILIFNTLAGLPGNQLDRMQSVINAAARLVCSARKYEHITPLLRDLHWLLVRERIEFKLAVLVFRCLHGTAPPYLANELCRVADIDAGRRLRYASTSALVTPSSRRSTIGDRAFFVAAPRVWNSLPSSVTASQTLGTFRRRLKTHLFAVPLPNSPCTESALRSFFCNVDWCTVFLKFFFLLNDTLIILV